MAINRGARASSHPTPSHFMATLPPNTHPLHVPHKHTLAQGSFGRSSIVRLPVLSLFVRSSDRSIVRPSTKRRPIPYTSTEEARQGNTMRPLQSFTSFRKPATVYRKLQCRSPSTDHHRSKINQGPPYTNHSPTALASFR